MANDLNECYICNKWEMKMKEFIIAFDIPVEERSFKVKINRILKANNAKMIQKSIWSSSNLSLLVKLATWIKEVGGKARILEEKLIFE